MATKQGISREEKILGQLQTEMAAWLGPDFEVEAESGMSPLITVTHRPNGTYGARVVFWYDRPDFRRKLDPELGKRYAKWARLKFAETSIRTTFTEKAREEAQRAMVAIEEHGKLR